MELGVVLNSEKINLSDDVLEKKDIIVIPKLWKNETEYIDIESAMILKEIRLKGKEIEIANRGHEVVYSDFHGGEYELALFVLKNMALPILIGIIANRIDKKIEKYKMDKKEEPSNVLIKEPKIKIKYYNLDKKEYIEIEGSASEVKKEIADVI